MIIFQIGELKRGINPSSVTDLNLDSKYLPVAIKTGIVTGIIALAVRIFYFNLAVCYYYFINYFVGTNFIIDY